MTKTKIAITMGDPAGIGPEIILKCLPRFENRPIVIIGSRGVFEKTREWLNLDCDFNPYLLDLVSDLDFEFGKVSKNCGKAANQAIQIAIDLLKKGEITGLVTAPISKTAFGAAIRRTGFTGHTEVLAQAFQVKNYAMLAYSEPVKIVLVTIHKPITKVSRFITQKNVFDKIMLLNDFFIRFLGIASPKIGVLAFNPHSFEFSGGEERKIERAVARAQGLGLKVSGPFPADSLRALLGSYHGFVAMFHDQAMLPVKFLSEGRGVNVTLGLPFIRTSPLHGTAFDIAGKGIASAVSMEAAIDCALKWAELSYKKV